MSDFLDPQQRHYLEVMGIQLWERRDGEAAPVTAARPQHGLPPVAAPEPATEVQPTVAADAPAVQLPDGEMPETTVAEPAFAEIAELDWSALEQRITQCTACEELAASRSQTVFGVGNRQADLLVIGEAPGADEDRLGEPFVGRAGQLLNAMLHGIGYARDQVYIANILKCRPPNNRDPRPEEAQACSAYLQRQIALIQPRAILAVGRIAAQNLLHSDAPIGKLRGQWHQHESGVPLVVTYHPAYLLRSPLEKRKAWSDLCMVRRQLSSQAGDAG